MRAFLGVILAAVVSTSYALFPRQNGYPPCTQSCLANANTSCQVGEVKCMCQDTAFINQTTVCFQQSCSASDLAKAEATAEQVCSLAGAPLPSSPPSSSSPASPATAAAASTPSPTSPQGSPASTSSSSSKPNGASSNMVNIMGGAAALGLAALAL